MISQRLNKKILLLLIGDAIFLYAALFFAVWARYFPEAERFMALHLFPFTVVFAVWIFSFGASGLYELRLMKNGKLFLYRLLRVMGINTLLAITLFYLFPFAIEPRRNLLVIVALAILLIFAWRSLFNHLAISATSSRVLFLGANTETVALAEYLLAHPQFGHKPVGFILYDEFENAPLPQAIPRIMLGENNFLSIIHDTKADLAIISREVKGNSSIVKMLLQAIPLGILSIEFPAFHEMITGKIPLSLIEETWFLENLIGMKKRSYEFAKRVIDTALVGVIAIAALFVHPFIALAIKLESDGSVFFRQTRVGMHGKTFQLIKYRSMINHADKMGGLKGQGSDTRHTRVGAFLRASYLDEIPQIINILRGEMSLIGPRPERPEYVDQLRKKIPFYDMRLLVPPGITGWAQVNMKDDASVEDAPEKMQYDLYYIKNRSMVLDILIALRTISTILQRQGR